MANVAFGEIPLSVFAASILSSLFHTEYIRPFLETLLWKLRIFRSPLPEPPGYSSHLPKSRKRSGVGHAGPTLDSPDARQAAGRRGPTGASRRPGLLHDLQSRPVAGGPRRDQNPQPPAR